MIRAFSKFIAFQLSFDEIKNLIIYAPQNKTKIVRVCSFGIK